MPAHAALHGPVSADASGDPNDQFTDQDALFAYVLSDTAGGRICVVSATGDPGGLSCDSPAPGMGGATHVLSIGTYFTLVKNAPLRPGAYRLLVEDSLNTPGDVSDVFTVTACSTCARTPDAAVVDEFKAAATEMGKNMKYMCTMQGVLEFVAGKAIGLRGISEDITVPAPAYPSSILTFAMSTGESPVLFTIQDPLTANINKALDILKHVSCGTALMYHDQASDPPDPNFGSVLPPVFTTIDTFSPPELDSAIRSVDRERGVGRALLHDFERYQGAVAAANEAGQILQLNAAGQNASDLAREIEHTATLLRTWADVAAADPELAGVALSSTDAPALEALYARVRDTGFLAEEIAQFHTLGYTDSDIASIRTHASLDLSQLSLDTPYPEMLRSVAGDLNVQADHYDQFSSEMFVVAARIEGANTPPNAVDDTLTTVENTPDAVDVLANDTDADGDALSLSANTNASHGSVSCGATGTCTYAPVVGFNGVDSFTYTVSDGKGGSSTGTVNVTISASDPGNQLPVANFTVDTPRTEGRTLTFDSTASSDVDGYISRWDWDFGDGELLPNGGKWVNHAYVNQGAYEVRLTVTDNVGSTDTTTQQLVVENVAPTVTSSFPVRVPPGVERLYTAELTDPGVADQQTVTWGFGDGSEPVIDHPNLARSSSVGHTYANSGTFTVSITADDGDGGTDMVQVTVLVAAAVADAGPDQTVAEGSSVSLGGQGSSPQDGFTSFNWDFGEGGTDVGRTIQHTFLDQGTYQATLTVGDAGDGTVTASDTATVTVTNAAPAVSLLAPSASTPGETVSLRAWATDPGAGDVMTIAWNFGDGATGSGEKVDHTYATAGTYTATVTVSDGDGGITAKSQTIIVAPDPPGDGRRDSHGTDFWVAMMTNLHDWIWPTDPQIFIASETATSGVVAIPGLHFSATFTVAAGSVTKVSLPVEVTKAPSSGSVQPWGIHVAALASVSVYGLNQVQYSTDGFLGLPREVLGQQYYAVGYDGYAGGEVGVLATRNDTTVTMRALDGTTARQTLDAGDVWLVSGPDYTGVSITSDRAVAAFSGAMCGNVPTTVGACNHLVEQLTPTSQWGKSFFTAPLATRLNGDRIRVVAGSDATQVRVNGTLVATLDAGQFHDQVVEGPANVETSKPVEVAYFAHSGMWDSLADDNADPSMMLVVPHEQYQASYVVATPSELFVSHYINVVTPANQQGQVQLDGTPVPATSFSPIATTGWSYAQLLVSAGAHQLSAPQPFGLTQYGWGNWDAYSWAGGSQLADIATVKTLLLTPSQGTSPTGQETCLTATITDTLGHPVTDARIDWTATGEHPDAGHGFADIKGEVKICLTASTAGVDTITARLGDLSAQSTITWTSANTAPTATAAAVTTLRDTAAQITLAGSDPQADPLTFQVTQQPAHGTLTGTPPSLTYTPDLGFTGADTLAFTVNDGKLTSPPATVAITVHPVNRAPVTTDMTITTAEDTPAPVTLEATDPEDGVLAYTVIAQPEHGTITGTAPALTYTPTGNFNGIDRLTFKACDNGTTAGNADPLCGTANVNITVTPVNDPPSVTSSPGSQQVQYSDGIAPVSVTATDADSAPAALSASTSWKGTSDPGFLTTTPLGGLALSRSSTSPPGVATWVLSGRAQVRPGTYTVRITVTDGTATAYSDTTLVVTPEDVSLLYTGDTLTATGTSGTATLALSASAEETNDGAPGDQLGSARLQFDLFKSTDTAMTTPTTGCSAPITLSSQTSGQAACNVSGLAADTYTVKVTMVSTAFYTAPTEFVVATVAIPTTGAATGGGWLIDPSNNTRANFGFAAKSKGTKVSGGSLFIYRRTIAAQTVPDGTGGYLPAGSYSWIIKSNAMKSVAQQCTLATPSICTVSFSGKATIKAVNRATGQTFGLGGNFTFQVDVTDHGEPGTGPKPDTYAIKVTDGTTQIYRLGTPDGQQPISGGNIQVKK